MEHCYIGINARTELKIKAVLYLITCAKIICTITSTDNMYAVHGTRRRFHYLILFKLQSSVVISNAMEL